MARYFVQYGEKLKQLIVPLQDAGGKPSPAPSAAVMRLEHMWTGAVLERQMTVDATPADRVNLVYDWSLDPLNWTLSGFQPGPYKAWWVMTISGEATIAPSRKYDILTVQGVASSPSSSGSNYNYLDEYEAGKAG